MTSFSSTFFESPPTAPEAENSIPVLDHVVIRNRPTRLTFQTARQTPRVF